ncbi:hypothetical protein PR048_004640 [Dryococelus australis]|uniref:Uncharacterized protein n=1 Tax=Dryococelus australis TaxID=614101 RepID=A0ABQ9I5Y9_9NEOP|nr:hypothetical protein PR048_004640 [Dryococelus australis]
MLMKRNISLLTAQRDIASVQAVPKPSDILQQIGCDIYNENCLLRKCENCISNEIHFSHFKGNDIGVYLKCKLPKKHTQIKIGIKK